MASTKGVAFFFPVEMVKKKNTEVLKKSYQFVTHPVNPTSPLFCDSTRMIQNNTTEKQKLKLMLQNNLEVITSPIKRSLL